MISKRESVLYLESSGDKRDEINQGLLSEGNRLTELLKGTLSVITVGDDLPVDPKLLGRYGVSSLYHIKGDRLSPYSPEVHAWALKEALKEVACGLLLFPHSDRGGDLAPRVAAYLGTACIANCVDISVKDGVLSYTRQVYGGQFAQEISFVGCPVEVASINTQVLDIRDTACTEPLRIVHLDIEVPPEVKGPVSLGVTPPDFRTVDILYAKRIVGAGIGCAEPRLMALVMELSDLLEGSVGTTRPVVDEGYLARERMIGQTGKTVAPDLYLALGVSGSPHHVAGIQQTKKILSVNRNVRAPVFDVSDAGFVGNLDTLLPKLIERIKRFRDEGFL